MLRKRTTFRPNLQATSNTSAGLANNAISSTPSNIPAVSTQQPSASTETLPNNVESCNKTTANSNYSTTVTLLETEVRPVINDQVAEAIAQLTGQKFEPIKSLSLRSSANKNVKLKDLLFFNPPMTKDQKRHKKNIYLAKRNERRKRKRQEHEDEQEKNEPGLVQDQQIDVGTCEEPSLVPQVKLGPDGKLVLDESSTIIDRKNTIKSQEAIVEDSEDVISKTNYDSFRRRPAPTNQTKWSLDDTQKFYHALTILGTDFSMMESLLFSGHRSRTELHKKFKREERVNKLKIDIALSNRITVSSEELDDLKEIFYK